VGKSENAARPVELRDAGRWPLTERKRPELIAVDRVGCARDSARLHRQSIQVAPDRGWRADAVRQLVRILFAIEELFSSAVRHENIFPVVCQDHDFEIM